MPDSPFLSFMDPNAGGGGMGGILSQLLDPAAQRRRQIADTLGGISSAILQASAPQVGGAPRGLLDVLGAGINGGVQANQGGEDRSLKRALTASQVAAAQSALQQDQAFRDLLTGGAPGAPTSATQFGPPASAAPPAAPAGPGPAAPVTGSAIAAPDPNNIGNVRPVGASTGFQSAADLPAGINMAVNNAKAYPAAFNNGQPMNLIQIGERWAPKGDGANDPRQWAMNVAQIGGLDPSQPLDLNNPEVAARFARGVHGAEKGGAAVHPLPTYQAALSQPGQIPQGDGSGSPVQQAQYQPQQPRTFAEVVQAIPPGVRKLIGAMGRKEGLPLLMKYADPETTPAIDVQTGQVVFAPKTELGSGRYQPIDATKLGMERERLDIDKQRAAGEASNRDILPGGTPNQALLDFKKGVSAAQGTDPEGKMRVGDYDDARKANTELQTGALVARSAMAQATRVGQLLEGVTTGRFAGTTQDILKAAKGVGINLESLGVTDTTSKVEAAQSLLQQMAMNLRQAPGMRDSSFSNADRDYLERITPGILTTPEGRKLILDATTKVHQRQVDLAKIANDFMRSPEAKKDPNALYQKLQEFADKNPLFNEKDMPQAAGQKPGSLPLPNKDGAPRVLRFNPATGGLE